MNKAAFYKHVRAKLGPLDTSQVQGFETFLDVTEGLPLSHRAYIMATAWHETGDKMQPVREKGSKEYLRNNYDITGRDPERAKRYGNTTPGDGIRFSGRGYPQLTWKSNYDKADAALAKAGILKRGELLANPDLALRIDIAVFIMIRGMTEGWFTGKKLSNYLPASGTATRAQYIAARYIVNIQDRADLIEDYAQIFERGLRDAGVAA